MENTTQQTVNGFAVKLTPFTGLGWRTRHLAGRRRARVIGLEIFENGYSLVVLMPGPWRKPFFARGRYDDNALRKLHGVKDTHLQLVHAAREGEGSLRAFLAAYFGIQPEDSRVSRYYMPIQIPLPHQGG